MPDNKKNGLMGPSRVSRPADLVEYSEGSTVSRIVMKSSNGSVTLFSFDRGQNLSEHTTNFDALVEVIDGEGEFIIDGTAHNVAAGNMLILPAGIPHAVNAAKRFKMLLTMLR